MQDVALLLKKLFPSVLMLSLLAVSCLGYKEVKILKKITFITRNFLHRKSLSIIYTLIKKYEFYCFRYEKFFILSFIKTSHINTNIRYENITILNAKRNATRSLTSNIRTINEYIFTFTFHYMKV